MYFYPPPLPNAHGRTTSESAELAAAGSLSTRALSTTQSAMATAARAVHLEQCTIKAPDVAGGGRVGGNIIGGALLNEEEEQQEQHGDDDDDGGDDGDD